MASRAFVVLLAMSAALTIGAPPAGAAAPDPRSLALEGRRRLESGDLQGAREALIGARAALSDQARHQPDLSDHLAVSLYNLGVQFNNAGDAEAAIDVFMEVIGLAPAAPRMNEREFRGRCVESTLGIAAWLVSAGRPARALEATRRLAALEPADAGVLLGLANAALGAGSFDEAEDAYRRAGEIAPDRPEPPAGEARVALSRAGSIDPGSRDLAANQEESQRLLERAVGGFDDAARRSKDPEPYVRERAKARIALSQVHRQRGDVAGAAEQVRAAESDLRAALASRPASRWSAVELASLLFGQRRFAEAGELYREAADWFDASLRRSPSDPNAATWRRAAETSRQSAAACSYNLAVDALNQARFDDAERLLVPACPDPARQDLCVRFREAAAVRRRAFEASVAALESALARDPKHAVSRLELGDLYARVGWWDRAREQYERVVALGESSPAVADRIAAIAGLPAAPMKTERIDLPGGEVRLVHFRERPGPEVETAVKAAWLRVNAAFGDRSLSGPLTIVLYPNQRAFRERSGPRIGALVRGYYVDGTVSVHDAPSMSAVSWVSVFTHEISHHAVERLSGGGCPRWLSEGLARYVEGDSTVVDRARVRRRIRDSGIPPLADLDARMDRFWNDPETYFDWRDAALLAVEEIARSGGTPAILGALRSLKESPGEEPASVLGRALGRSLDDIDAGWRTTLMAGARE